MTLITKKHILHHNTPTTRLRRTVRISVQIYSASFALNCISGAIKGNIVFFNYYYDTKNIPCKSINIIFSLNSICAYNMSLRGNGYNGVCLSVYQTNKLTCKHC